MAKKQKSWDRNSVFLDAKKYATRSDWNKASYGAVLAAKRLGIYEAATAHMPRKKKKWTEESILAEAKKHESRSEWIKNSSGSYEAAKRLGCLDAATRHMQVLLRSWTDEDIFVDAKKYKTRTEWQRASGSAYNKARKKGMLEKCCAHMEEPTFPNGYWTKERLIESASKYQTKKEWRAKDYRAYTTAHQKGLVDEVAAHMTPMRTSWTKDMVLAEARKYRTRKEWRSISPRSYNAGKKNGWYGEATVHMSRLGSRHWRRIYQITVRGTKLAYVGLSYNIEDRFRQHLKTKRFLQIAKTHGTKSIEVRALTDYLPVEDAARMEKQLIEEYGKQGYQLLNRAVGGGTGGNDIRWTRRQVRAEAIKYQTKQDWRDKSRQSYEAAYKKGWLDEMTSHMPNYRGYFSIEEIIADARNYKTKTEWKKASPRHSRQAKEIGCYEEATSHMKRPPKATKWTKEALIADARKYKTKKGWSAANRSAYSTAHRIGCFDSAYA